MSKTITIVLIVFWVSFMFASAIFNFNGSSYQDLINDFKINPEPNLGDYVNLVWSTLKFFVQSLTLTFPDMPVVFTLPVILLEIMSALVIVWSIMDYMGKILESVGGLIKFI